MDAIYWGVIVIIAGVTSALIVYSLGQPVWMTIPLFIGITIAGAKIFPQKLRRYDETLDNNDPDDPQFI